MATNQTRFGVAAMLALSLSAATGGALAAPVSDPPRPLPSGAELTVRPGDRVTISTSATVDADTRNGVRVVSGAFVTAGTLRREDHLVTAIMTVACTAASGPYEVRFRSPVGEENPSGIDRLWGSVRVAPADETERVECARRVSELPLESQEEHWPGDAPWPQTPWDVRTVRAGGTITATDNSHMAGDGEVKLSSPAFTQSVVMRGSKKVDAAVRIRCEVQPGVYTVHWNEKGKPAKEWARYRVTEAAPGCQDPAIAPQAGAARKATPWLVGSVAALSVMGGAGYVLLRRRRKASH
ncbi:hypothetical protein GT352_12185 [Streptomyces sp. SID1046]|uniref:hypothetical protein n=1 Tax=Streptomyces sp. SID1046 TaxID=2690249 RepID=UPI00136913A6|nr:hypothetical protein [Streptomyces sp. SID1046]MYV74684.1 hypothetical protein [Streptomyces sp. SID1046]